MDFHRNPHNCHQSDHNCHQNDHNCHQNYHNCHQNDHNCNPNPHNCHKNPHNFHLNHHNFHQNHHNFHNSKTISQISFQSYLKVAMLVAEGETKAPAVVTGMIIIKTMQNTLGLLCLWQCL